VSLSTDGSGNLQLNATPVSIANCSTTTGNATVTCTSTTGLSAGMVMVGQAVATGTNAVTGATIYASAIPNNSTVTSIPDTTHFVISSPATLTATAQTLSAFTPAASTSADQFLMRVSISGSTYDECWQVNRNVNPKTVTVTWRLPGATTTTTYANVNNRLTAYPMNAWSETKLPDTSETSNVSTAPQSQDSNYTINPQSFTDNGDGTITDNVTGLMWQKVDNGESTWPVAVTNAAGVTTGGYNDWRLPTPSELSSIQNYNNNQPALDPTYFSSAPVTLTNCTTNGTTTITCASTAQLPTGTPASMSISGPNIPAGAKLVSVSNSTTFVISAAATGSSSGFTLTGVGGDYWWTSDAYMGSTTNTWCVNAGGGVGPKPLTETLSAGGIFRYCARYVRGTGKKPTNLHSYVNNGDGTITDTDTGLMWTQLPGAAMSWNSALSYATGLSTGGYGDWRLPNVKELETLTDYTLASATSATGILPSINRTMFAKTLTNCTTTSGGTGVACDDTTGLLPGMPVQGISSFQVQGCTTTSGSPTITCTNTTGLAVGMAISGTGIPNGATITSISPNVSFNISANATAAGTVAVLANYISANTTVASITDGTHFVLNTGAANTGSGLTLKALVPPTAYWTSSVVKAGTLTQAWLVETGINNSVPPASGPTRNAQGIISYEIFASTYPVFAVRNTTVSTQIAVAQGANTLTDGVSTVGYAAAGSKTFTITNTGVTSLTLSGITIDGTNASNFSLVNAPANPTTLAPNGTATFSVQFSAASAASYSAALHIANSDPAVNGSFDVNLTGNIPVIGTVAISPATPTNADTPTVTATMTPVAGRTISQVQLTYNVGTQTTATAFQEIFANASFTAASGTSFSIPGNMNAWSANANRAAADVKLRGGTGNHTTPVVLSNCTTNGTTTVTCASTTGLIPGMSISGTNIAGSAMISSVTNGTTFVITPAATGSGTSLTLTAAGVTLTGCSLGTSPIVNTASTTGLSIGMGVSGTGLSTNPPNPTVASTPAITATTFPLSSTVTAVPATLTASGCGLELSTGTTTYTDTMATITNPINAGSALSGYVEFYVQNSNLVSNNGWQFQISPDGGTTWNTRLSENYTSASAANCTLNSANNQTSGSTTVLCPNTAGLTVGNFVQGTGITVASCTTSTVTNPTVVLTPNTGSLAVGMFVSGNGSAGIPNGARITAINPGVSFTMNVSATASATSTLLANYFNANTTISSITANTSFVVNNAVFYSGSGITVSSVNHGFNKMHYDFVSADMTATMKMRFQFSGYNPGGGSVLKAPLSDFDDIIVSLTTGIPPVTVTMNNLGGGVYGVQLPAFAAGTTVTFSISVTDSTNAVTTLASAGGYTTTLPLAVTTTSPLPNALTSAAYTQALAATGGTGPYTWAVTGGSLPPGITLGTNGTFSGTATAVGSYSFTATVTDNVGHTASRTFALTSATPPNILIILTDDQGWADIGYHTYPGRIHIDTPNMDSFATSGIRMERFYPTAVCSVTRACMLTGRNTIRTGVNNSRGLDLSEQIMPQTFNAAGYQSFITGKWHVGGPENNICYTTVNGQTVRIIQEGDQYRPYNRGWKLHYGEYGVIDAFTHYESSLLNPVTQPTWLRPDWWLNGVQYYDGDPTQNTDAEGDGGYATNLLADKAASIITNSNGDRDPTKPLLLYLPFSQVHGPVSAPPEYLAKYGNPSDPTHYISDVPTRTIAASVDCLDVAIGRVFAALDSMGMTNNTFVIFMSDNGGENATGGCDLPLRGAKTEPYDGGLRTPCGMRFPGKLAGGLQVPNCVTTSGTTVTCISTSGLYAGMALAGTGLAYGTTVASVTDGTHFVLSTAPTTPSTPSSITITAGVISNMFFWVGDLYPTLCAVTGVTPLNTKPFDGLNMWPALQTISGANPDGIQTRFQTNPDGSKNTTTTNISPLVTLATPNVAYNTYTDPISGQTKVFKDIYSPGTNAVILTHCTTVTGSTTVTCDSTTGLTAGGNIYGVGIKGNATVISITDATHFVMSDPPNIAYPNATYTNPITLNVGFTTNQLFNIQDDPYETTDYMLPVNQTALGLTSTQIQQFNAIVSAMQTSISINPIVYPPYVGPTLITNTAAQGSTIQLYVPFTSYAKNPPLINWRKNGVNITDGATGSGSTISGSAIFTQNTTAPDTGYGSPSVPTNGAYNTILTITNVTTSDAGSYDLVISNLDTYQTPNVTNTVYAPAGTLSVVVGSPVLATLPAYTKGTSQTISWSAVTNATSYTVQAATDVNFTNVVSTKTTGGVTVTFSNSDGLTSGTAYFFRATATDGVTTSVSSNVVTSTQDAGNPVVTITSPTDGSTTAQTTVTVQGTATDAISGIASVTVNGVVATTSDNYAHWTATNVPLTVGANPVVATATDNAQPGGNTGTASISVTLNSPTPVISSISTGPTAPTYQDSVWVTARVDAGTYPISQVQLVYNVGVPIVTTVFQEVFSNTSSSSWNGTGALNAWTPTGAGNVRQAVGTSNHTVPIGITGCTTTAGGTTVTCTSTANLWPGMLVTGLTIPGSITGSTTGNTTISSITNGTTFVLSQAASSPGGNGLTLTAAGVALTNCTTTTGSSSVTCTSTAGLVNGMSLSGTGLANNTTVQSVNSGTSFTMSTNPTTASSPGTITITASGAAAELNGGTSSLTGTMFSTTNAINTTGNSGYVEFYVQTSNLAATNNNQWTFQVAPDGNLSTPTYVTRISEDWNSKAVNLSNCVLNSTGATAGSTNVTCTSTTGLVAGQTVAGPNVYVTCGLTNGSSTLTCTNTTGLANGMFISGAGGSGIPNNTYIANLVPNTSFTMATGTAGTAVNATATVASTSVAATYFPPNATVSSITNPATFVISTPAYVNTLASPIAATATTINHGFQKYHYDLSAASGELGPNTKLRFQFAGYTPTSPTPKPRVDVDDIVVSTTQLPPPITVIMRDDGSHGDGGAGDHVYGALIPMQPGGTTVNFYVTATDTNATTTTSSTSSYTVNSALTDTTITNAEFLTIPSDTGVTLNVVASSAQDAYVEYGTASGSYPNKTPVTTFNTAVQNAVGTGTPVSAYPITIPLAGLTPNTDYYYRLRYRNSGTGAFNARGERSFGTARPRGSSFVFTITADPHLDFNTDPALLTQTLANIAADQPDFHIDLGDIFMTDKMSDTVAGIPAQYGGAIPNQSRVNGRALILRSYYEQTCHSVPYLFTLGNHEAEYGYTFNAATDPLNNIPAWDLIARQTYYPAPVPSSFYSGNATPLNYTGGTLGLLQDYYAWEWGDALFIVLDPYWNTVQNPVSTQNAWNWSLGQAQYNWLAATLQNSSARYKFVFMHHLVGGTWTLADGVTSNCAARGGVEVVPYFEWGGKNVDGTDGFAANRPGWAMPIHNLLVQNKVNVVFHGHDHLYGYQMLDGIVYLECPQPGAINSGVPTYSTLGSAPDGKYSVGTLLPSSGHIRVTVTPTQALSEYVKAYSPTYISLNRSVSHSFTLAPRIFPPVEITAKTATSATFRWNAVPNKLYSVQWSPDLVNWYHFDAVTPTAVNTNFTYTDTNTTQPLHFTQPKGFYRVSYSP